MKTFHQFMEQIPHVGMTQMDVMRARQGEIAKRQNRRHVHRELEHRADKELANKEKVYGQA